MTPEGDSSVAPSSWRKRFSPALKAADGAARPASAVSSSSISLRGPACSRAEALVLVMMLEVLSNGREVEVKLRQETPHASRARISRQQHYGSKPLSKAYVEGVLKVQCLAENSTHGRKELTGYWQTCRYQRSHDSIVNTAVVYITLIKQYFILSKYSAVSLCFPFVGSPCTSFASMPDISTLHAVFLRRLATSNTATWRPCNGCHRGLFVRPKQSQHECAFVTLPPYYQDLLSWNLTMWYAALQ